MRDKISKVVVMAALMLGCMSSVTAKADTFALFVATNKNRYDEALSLAAPPNDQRLWIDMLLAYSNAQPISQPRHSLNEVIKGFHGLEENIHELAPATYALTLSDEKATWANVIAGFQWLASKVNRNDVVFVAFSGHAMRVANKYDDPQEIPHDPDKKSGTRGLRSSEHEKGEQGLDDQALILNDSMPNTDPLTCLIDDEIGYHMRKIGTQQKLLLIDSCYAHGADKGIVQATWDCVEQSDGTENEKGEGKVGQVVISAAFEQIHTIRVGNIPISPCTYFVWSNVIRNLGISYSGLKRALITDYTIHDVTGPAPGPHNTVVEVPAKPDVYGASNVDLHLPFLWKQVIASQSVPTSNKIAGLNISRAQLLPSEKPTVIVGKKIKSSILENAAGVNVALVVGINKWDDILVRSIEGGENDAHDMAEALSSGGYDVTLMTPDSDKPSLRPTYSSILNKISEIVRGKKINVLFFYFSGHGIVSKVNNKAYLMPVDARLEEPEKAGLSLEEITQAIRKENPAIKLLVLVTDACRVGADKISRGFVDALQRSASEWVLVTSCNGGQTSSEWSFPSCSPMGEPHTNGRFTGYLIRSTELEEYDSKSKGDLINLQEAYTYARKQFQANSSSQTPSLFGKVDALDNVPFSIKKLCPRDNQDILPEQILNLILDEKKHWVIYKPGTKPVLNPSNWMWGDGDQTVELSDEALSSLMQLQASYNKKEDNSIHKCMRLSVTWPDNKPWTVTWVGWGMTAVEEGDLWWATTNYGLYYDLTKPSRAKVLKFRACAEQENAPLKVKFGFLSRDAKKRRLRFGDSLTKPIEKKFSISADDKGWKEYSLPLIPPQKDGKQYDLSRITSLAFIIERTPDTPSTVTVYIDDIHVEFE